MLYSNRISQITTKRIKEKAYTLLVHKSKKTIYSMMNPLSFKTFYQIRKVHGLDLMPVRWKCQLAIEVQGVQVSLLQQQLRNYKCHRKCLALFEYRVSYFCFYV